MLLGCIGSARDVTSYPTSVTGRYLRLRGMPVTSNPVLLYVLTDARHDRCSLGSQAGSRTSPGPFGAGPTEASATSRSRDPSFAPLVHLGSGFVPAYEKPNAAKERPPSLLTSIAVSLATAAVRFPFVTIDLALFLPFLLLFLRLLVLVLVAPIRPPV